MREGIGVLDLFEDGLRSVKKNLSPLAPGKPRHGHAGETDAGANRGHAVGDLNAVKEHVGVPSAVAGEPVEVVTEAGREVDRRPVDLRDGRASVAVPEPILMLSST